MKNDDFIIRMPREKGKTDFDVRSNKQMYKCPGSTYWLEENVCNKRQLWYKGCSKCTVRKGGKNDPRKEQS